MTLYDDSIGVLLERLRPKSEIARVEAREALPPWVQMDARGAGVVLRVLEPAPGELAARDAVRSVFDLDQTLQRRLPQPAYAPWREHLTALPALASALSEPLTASHTALLTPLAERKGDASLAWFTAAAALPPRLHMAALLPIGTRRRRSRLNIETPLHCELCARPQHAAGTELEWLGSPASMALNVAPICRSCLGAAARDPQLWEQRRVRQHGSALRVISGAPGETPTAKAHGHLRLVREMAND